MLLLLFLEARLWPPVTTSPSLLPCFLTCEWLPPSSLQAFSPFSLVIHEVAVPHL